MKEYILRFDELIGSIVDLEELDTDPCGQCRDVEELEAIMVAMVKSLNERLAQAEMKIKELEARPIILSEPLLPYRDERPIMPDSPYGGWTTTCKH